MEKSLDTKLESLRSNRNNSDFIICYAADPDMATGIMFMLDHFDSLTSYYDYLSKLVDDAKLDILLTSTSTMDCLARQKALFKKSPVTPAIRANDSTDNWHVRGSLYGTSLSRPFSTTTLDEARYGTLFPEEEQDVDVNLGLYSVTFNNDTESDLYSLERLKDFRIEAAYEGFSYFMEIFNPNAPVGLSPEQIPDFVNDCISRMLAGMPKSSRPEFLKMQYNGPKAMEQLVSYTTAIVGVLGGSPSTTYDAFKMLAEAKKYGARVALYGRRILVSEDPVSYVRFLREVADENISPEEAVKAYHGALQEKGISPVRSLQDDMVIVTPEVKLSL